jgi:riboflavin synthase
VLGHVDAVGEVLALQSKGVAWEVTVSLPEAVRACVAPKGSIAIDGISLTVLALDADWFQVGIIPHTLKETTLRNARVGQQVNVEADVLARYVVRALAVQAPAGAGAAAAAAADYSGERPPRGFSGLTEERLREQGFV